MIKKVKLALLFGLMLLPLSACGQREATHHHSDSEYSSLKKKNRQLKKQVKKKSTSSSSSNTSSNDQGKTNDQKQIDSAQSSNGQTVTVSNEKQAIAIARAKYGDHNGDWKWECLSDGSSYNSNGYYFVKAISQSELANGSMTGTAMSCKVYPDGSVEEN
ncbi:hypothetical protein [Limosilactobacillus secaliphilus]|uniref:Lipoprotein n=1 Tax=Limosilactobacillus secaliphilus TaxID=396268 RepID=A0A0R2I1S8_9LACO|nr:hypothetical protein [Limosilactobacillus secaliphilus]KRN58843.1 hypothetical protein IV45_GL000470 [Limosilactobacillus secaliphilus]